MIRETFTTHSETVDVTAKAMPLYLQALRDIINHREEAAGYALNRCRDVILEGRHWLKLTDADVQKIIPDPDFTADRFYSLYGDFGSKCKSTWIRDPEIVAMIGMHVALLGSAKDQENFVQMVCRGTVENSVMNAAGRAEAIFVHHPVAAYN